MVPNDWVAHLQDAATNYQVLDFALALIGDDEASVADAQPVMLLRVKHLETELEFDFTFTFTAELAEGVAMAMDSMSFDLSRDCVLGALDGHIIDDSDDIV